MSYARTFTIQPPEDVEMHLETRKELAFSVEVPDAYDPSREYPLIFAIPGWGDFSESEYQARKLRPYLAEKYEAIVVGVRYHDDKQDGPNYSINHQAIKNFYRIADQDMPSGSGQQIVDGMFSILIKKNIFSMDRECAIYGTTYADYCSFGFLPALDHLDVFHFLMKSFKIRKDRVFLLGSSYGGYVALLMSKFAPYSFCMATANSPFVKTNLQSIFPAVYRGSGCMKRMHLGLEYQIPIIRSSIWSPEETSPGYFSDAHREIRSLLRGDQWIPSDTLLTVFHSLEDGLEPIAHVDRFAETVREKRPIHYERIGPEELDGTLFKDLSHGMGASIRGIFDRSWEIAESRGLRRDRETDFDRESVHAFHCGRKTYRFRYHPEEGVRVEIEDSRG